MNAIDPDTQKRKKTIIYAWNYVEWGGAQIYTLALIREAQKYWDVLVVLPYGSSSDLIRFFDELGVKYEFFEPKTDLDPAISLRRKLQRHWRKAHSESALIGHVLAKNLQNAVIHIDFTPQQSFLSLLRLCSHMHVFFTMHNALQAFTGWRELIWAAKIRLLARTGRFHMLCANEDAKIYISRFVSENVRRSIRITRAGIDPYTIGQILEAEFDRNEILARCGLAGDKTLVLTVGQFIDRKGRWPYMETIRNILRNRKDIQFLWLMPNFPGDIDKARVEEYELGEYFKMILSADVGKSRTEVLEFFRVADLFVLPSFVEGVPISLLEAMALGLPSISCRINGIPEAIESGKSGLLVDSGDVDALKNAIEQLVDDPALRNELAIKGQSFVLSKFDEQKAAQIAVDEYGKYLC